MGKEKKQRKKITISEHAKAQFARRALLGISKEEFDKLILTDEAMRNIANMKYADGKYPAGGHRLVIENGVVVTVVVDNVP